MKRVVVKANKPVITKEEFIEEFKKGQKKYANDNRTGKFNHMDLPTFMWNMYEENIKKLRRLQRMWTPEMLKKYLSDPPIKEN